MVRTASLWVSGLVWCSMSVAGPVGNQQNPSLTPDKSVTKDSLIAGTSATPSTDPYGFKPLLADNSLAFRPAAAPAASNASTAHSLTYTPEAHSLAAGFEREFLKSDKEKLTNMKSWGAPYFARIERILADHNLPKELEYLAVIESELKHSATSRVGAKGLWQFMPETARLYGLTVNGHRDDRTDLELSTRAASRYLQDLYDELHDWLLVIAAYDGGTARIHSAIRKAGSRDFFDLQYYLALESRNHVKRFIATNFYMGIVPAGPDLLPGGTKELETALSEQDLASTEVQTISGHYTAAVIAQHLGIPLPELIHLNPHFDNQVTGAATDDCYNLRLPRDKMALFNEDKNVILKESVQELLNEDEEEKK
jgi:membrane-bound lytic murein transglycosylase D